MLTRKKKTRPWLKGKKEEWQILAKIADLFDKQGSLDTSLQQFGELMMANAHSVESGIYLYDHATNGFSLRFSYGKPELLSKYHTLTLEDLRLCQIVPTEFGMINVIAPPKKQTTRHPFLQACEDHSILTLAYLPLIAHDKPYGILLLASKYAHHITEEEKDFFKIIITHVRFALEKSLLTEQFEHEVSLKVSQLQESEEKYRLLFEDASDAIVIVDFATQRFLETNRQAEIFSGYSREELLTMMVSDLWVKKEEKRLAVNLLRSIGKQKSVKLHERQIRRKNGSLLWIEINASAVEYHGKKVVLAIVRDVSRRKQLELEKEVIEAVNKALISSYDIRDVYRTVGQNLLKVFSFDWMDILLPGSTSQTLRLFVSVNVNKNISNLGDREYVQNGTTIKTIFQTGKPEIVSYGDERKNRSLPELLGKELQTSLFFPLEYKEKIIGILHFGSYYDDSFSPRHFDFLQRITSQIAIAIDDMLLFQKVNQERAVYKHLIENVNELIFQVDLKGKIVFVNHRVRDILGYTPEEIIGTNFFSYVLPVDLEEAKAAFRLVMRHEQPLSGEYRAIHKNGTVLTISIYTRPIFEDGRAIGMQGIVQDITPPPTRFAEYRLGFHDLIGRSPHMQEIYDLIMSVAQTDSTVLIHGESGTGKELIAQAIHAYSHRKDKPFIVVNCAAYSEHLLESELFGHERGAFTGAHKRKLGRFELAKGGTIFLDEVGEIPLHSQLLLLRVIQNKTFERVGGEKTLETDVRIVAATNKRLEEEMKAGRFREDLYYRLNVILIHVPPLRDRKEDIPYLVEHFLKKYSNLTGKQILKCSQSAIELLMNYDWYGNVRELENVIERAVVMTSGSVILPENLPSTLWQQKEVSRSIEIGNTTNVPSLYDHEKEIILKTLQSTNWNKYRTAKLLGITRSTLYSKIEKYHLNPEKEHHTRNAQ